MGAPAGWDWLYLVIGWTLAGAAALLALRALFWDRAKGKRRCPKCWYDMQGTPGLRCSECGREAKTERKLFRTRRRWRLVTLAMVIGIAAYATASVPRYQRGGWTALIPSSILVIIAPAKDPVPKLPAGLMPGPIVVSGQVVTARQRSLFMPPPATPPPVPTASERLIEEVWSRLQNRRLSSWQSQIFLGRYIRENRHDPQDVVSLPERWPVGESIPARVERMTIGGLPVDVRDARGTWMQPPAAWFAPRPAPTNEVTLHLGLKLGANVAYEIPHRYPLVISGTRDTFLTRLNSSEANQQALEALAPDLAMSRGEIVVIIYDRSERETWRTIDFGLAYTFEISVNGEVIGTGSGKATWNSPVWKDWDEAEIRWQGPGREALTREGSRPVIRIRGDHAPCTESYITWPFDKPRAACWTGEFTTTLELKEHPGLPK